MKKILFTALLGAAVLWGCDNTETPDHDAPATLQSIGCTQMTIKQLKDMYSGGPTTVEAPNLAIVGKVISTDEDGNFYRSFYIQDETGGIEIKEGNRNGLFTKYHVGQTILVKPHHLTLGKYGEMISLGYKATGYENEWLDAPLLIAGAIFRGNQGPKATPIAITNGSEITDDMMGTWVTIVNAEYVSGDSPSWGKPDDKSTPGVDEADYGAQNFKMSDGATIVVRTSGYAKFAGTTIPFAPGAKVDITAVLTKYFTTRQLMLNTDKDVVVK